MNKNNKNLIFQIELTHSIILPLISLQVQEEFHLPIHHTMYFDCSTVKTWPVLYSPSRSIGPGMDNPLNFSETDH